jgi:tetratricopeptide (TPR) repeat protein
MTRQEQKQQVEQAKGPAPEKTTAPAGTGAITEKELLKIVKSHAPAEEVIATVKKRTVEFDLTSEIEARLRKAKASDQVIQAVMDAGPAARTTKIISAGVWGTPERPVSPQEGEDFVAVWNEKDPNKVISAGGSFIQKWPNSSLTTYVFSAEGDAYSAKGDVEKAVEAAKKGLELKSDNVMALLVLSRILPQPRYLVSHEAEKVKEMAEAEGDANRGLQILSKQAGSGSGELETDLKSRISSMVSDFHAALGMVHLDRATEGLTGVDKEELAKAEQEFNVAVTATPNPSPLHYFRLGETYAADDKINEAVAAFTKASQLGQGSRVTEMADKQIADLKQRASQPSK